MNFSILWLLGT